MYMKELELNFIPKNKKINELEDYARRNKLTGYSNLRKQKLIELVNSDRKEKVKNLLSPLWKKQSQYTLKKYLETILLIKEITHIFES